jgi:hypothetical protein
MKSEMETGASRHQLLRERQRESEVDTLLRPIVFASMSVAKFWSVLKLLPTAVIVTMASANTSLAATSPAPTRDETIGALRRAVGFYRTEVSVHGSYGHRASTDLTRREGEQAFTSTQGWIEQPGTAAVGLAYLESYRLTREAALLDAAIETGMALVQGQLVSGGWCEIIEVDPVKRKRFRFRVDAPEIRTFAVKAAAQQPDASGFLPHDRPMDNEMNGREEPPTDSPINVTTFDDDKSQGSLRFLMLLDRELKFANTDIHSAVQYALEGFLAAQYPNGGWPQHFREKITPPQPADLRASYPESWSRLHAWTGFSRYYTINDSTLRDLIRTMLLAHEIYGEKRFLDAAKRGGDFLILAQMPAPQPAWAQQYNFAMQPVWARIFEPPAVSGGESQAVMIMLIELAIATGERRYLEPVPRAMEYLRASLLPDGRLARFYELRTNRPLFMTKKYELTYDGSDVPTHYGFYSRSQLDSIARSLADARRELAQNPTSSLKTKLREEPRVTSPSAAEVRAVISALDSRGAWVERGMIRVKGTQRADQAITSIGVRFVLARTHAAPAS